MPSFQVMSLTNQEYRKVRMYRGLKKGQSPPRAFSTLNTTTSDNQVSVSKDDCINVSIPSFWKHSTTAIFNIQITNLDLPLYHGQDPATLLQKAEKPRKTSSFRHV
eukprot:902805-Ditylum_brightwellii.AAC.1